MPRLIWLFWTAIAVVGVGSIIGILAVSRSRPQKVSYGGSAPVATWPAGATRAPGFNLLDQAGKPISLAAFHGRPVLVTFIDPVCRSLCPREASILSQAATELGPDRPAIVAVSVDPWADSAANFRVDASHWHLAAGWQWAVGSYAQLTSVWERYAIGVIVSKHTYAGITIRKITHTEAAYVVDPSGHQRALLIYPFTTADVVSAVRVALAASSTT